MSMINEFVEKLIEKIKFGIEASNINDDYTTGLRNGMRYCLSLIDGKEPEFESCKQGWIPCSERLPGYGVGVLIQDFEGNYEIGELKLKNGIYGFCSGELGWWTSANHYIAWQPLPEPYKG